jgi:hypothetical protein
MSHASLPFLKCPECRALVYDPETVFLEGTCPICLDPQRPFVLFDCKHGACESCSESLRRQFAVLHFARTARDEQGGKGQSVGKGGKGKGLAGKGGAGPAQATGGAGPAQATGGAGPAQATGGKGSSGSTPIFRIEMPMPPAPWTVDIRVTMGGKGNGKGNDITLLAGKGGKGGGGSLVTPSTPPTPPTPPGAQDEVSAGPARPGENDETALAPDGSPVNPPTLLPPQQADSRHRTTGGKGNGKGNGTHHLAGKGGKGGTGGFATPPPTPRPVNPAPMLPPQRSSRTLFGRDLSLLTPAASLVGGPETTAAALVALSTSRAVAPPPEPAALSPEALPASEESPRRWRLMNRRLQRF